VAYDEDIAERVRDVLAPEPGLTERKMFGGLAFMLDGKMFCGVLGGELLARVGPDAHDDAVARPHVRIMDFTGRPMRGYVFVGPAALASDAALSDWVGACAKHVATLPEKARKGGKKPGRRPAKPAAPSASRKRAPRRRAPARSRSPSRQGRRPGRMRSVPARSRAR
jgi:hypothetical protein